MFAVVAGEGREGGVRARTSWTVQSVREDRTRAYYGWAECDLAEHGDTWLIARKKTVVLNDVADTMIDVYNV